MSWQLVGTIATQAEPLSLGELKALRDELSQLRSTVATLEAKSPIGISNALVNKDGCLVLTFSDGTVKEVGVVVGKDGAAGKDGIGRDGKDGADGLGFDDLEFISRGPRGITLKFTRGDRTKSFDWDAPIPIYQGTFEVGKSYETGDMVTRQGSVWFCKSPTSEMPGDGAKSWQLCVKRGSPGQKGEQGPVGATGKPGVDLTQMDNAGRKW